MSRTGIYDIHDGFIPDDDCPQQKPKQTNADLIRRMTDKELAKEIVKCRDADIYRDTILGTHMNTAEEWLEWLKKEAKGGEI